MSLYTHMQPKLWNCGHKPWQVQSQSILKWYYTFFEQKIPFLSGFFPSIKLLSDNNRGGN